jgi:hypothetical protein
MNTIVDFLTQETPDGNLAAILAGVVEKTPAVPSFTKTLGLFTAEGVPGTTVKLDQKNSVIGLVQTSARGTDAPSASATGRGPTVHFEAVRVALERQFLADEILNLRKLGTSEFEISAIEQYFVNELAPVSGSVRATLENHRLGALRGYVLDANSDVITDLYTKFGITEPDTVYFDLTTAPSAGVPDPIRRKLAEKVVRPIKKSLGAIGSGQIWAMCGSQFFDELVGAEECRETYANQAAASALREGTAMTGRVFKYGDVNFVENFDTIGGTDLVDADEVRFFPAGVPGLFRQFFAPHDRDASIPGKGIGQPEYALPSFDPKGRYREVEIQSNPVTICTRPQVLIGGRAGADPAP